MYATLLGSPQVAACGVMSGSLQSFGGLQEKEEEQMRKRESS